MSEYPNHDARQRLLDLATDRGVSLAGLSDMIGRNSSYLQQFIRKGSPRKLEEGDRRALAEFFGVAESELGGMEEKYHTAPTSRSNWVEVPRLPVAAAAGSGAVASGEQPFDSFRFSRRWLREHGLERAQLSAITVMGDSMEPLLNDGDEILVDTAQRTLRDGIHVVRVGDALMVKRLAAAGPDRVVLLSQNYAYPPQEFALCDIEIVGRVVWKGGRL
ncbi:S24 family peptidase [Tsuneonella suprasediminis]|uniref:S24 family peptidase n=1 Tax=Tsuneonella suprasediminis TaxID=2306996 RepID=A0A419R4K5_9SPHN|nr:S24 family peptidase [Tsuneonella suprasediminis]RJX69843.1 S24 family peptidase [Tsuneonella suprasediminis]